MRLLSVCMQFAPGTLFVPHSTAPAHLEMTGMQYAVHSSDAEQQLHGQSHMHHYMPDDSMLFQHYADMDVGQPGGLRNLLQTEPHATPPSKFGLDKAIGGETYLTAVLFSCSPSRHALAAPGCGQHACFHCLADNMAHSKVCAWTGNDSKKL